MIYVGGAPPGSAWIHSLERRNFAGRILCIDPSELDETYSDALNIAHVREFVRHEGDILSALKAAGMDPMSPFIFVWDVRHLNSSTMVDPARNEVIREEIAVLNGILNSPWFRNNVKMFQLKVNAMNIDAYELPLTAKLFIQPFTLDRDVYELRAVGHISDPGFILKTLSGSEIAALHEYYNGLKNELIRVPS